MRRARAAGALSGARGSGVRGAGTGGGGAPGKGVRLGIRKVWTSAHPGAFVNTSGYGLLRPGSG